LFTIALSHLGTDRTVTVSLTGEFAGSAREGDLIESSGEVVKLGGSLIFLRGIIETQQRPIMNFSGILKKIRGDT
jgi:acyl-coenzyme A thioesterase PaaI-like protein